MTREQWLTIIQKAITDIDGLEWEKGMNGLMTTIRLNRKEAVSLYELVKGSGDRPKGEWLGVRPKGGWFGVKCSICGAERAWYGDTPDFCPDCGAKMNGGGDAE